MLSVVILAVVLVATLTPAPPVTETPPFWCVACGESGGLDVLNNVVMFVPLGFAFALATDRRWRSVLACVAVTAFVESMQVRIVTGRDASLSDLLANSLGGVIGVELAMRRDFLLRPRPRAASRLVAVGGALFGMVTALTSLGLLPAAVPRSLWVQWTPDRASFDPFTGQLVDFTLDGIDLPRRFYPPKSLGVDSVLRGRSWRATATVITTNLKPGRAVIARIAEEFTVLVSVEQAGWDLACQQKTRSGDFRFRSPKIALRDALLPSGEASGMPLRLTCARAGSSFVSAADGRQEALRLSPSLGWMLVFPLNAAIRPSLTWIGAIWLMVLAFPAGYWTGFTRGGEVGGNPRVSGAGTHIALLSILLALLLGLVVVPLLAGTAPGAWWEWMGAAAGLAAGALTARALTRWSRFFRDRGPGE